MKVNSPQSLLPVVIMTGFTLFLAGILVELTVYFSGWPWGLSALAVVLAICGLFFLTAAWHIRQGLVHGPLVRYVANLINWIKMRNKKLNND